MGRNVSTHPVSFGKRPLILPLSKVIIHLKIKGKLHINKNSEISILKFIILKLLSFMKTSTEIIVALNVQTESCYLPSMKYLCIRKRSCHFSSFLRQAFALSPLCLHFLPINIPSPWVLLLEHWWRGLQHQSSTWWKKLMQLYQHHFFKCYPRSNISADTFKKRLNTNSVTILLPRRPD